MLLWDGTPDKPGSKHLKQNDIVQFLVWMKPTQNRGIWRALQITWFVWLLDETLSRLRIYSTAVLKPSLPLSLVRKISTRVDHPDLEFYANRLLPCTARSLSKSTVCSLALAAGTQPRFACASYVSQFAYLRKEMHSGEYSAIADQT